MRFSLGALYKRGKRQKLVDALYSSKNVWGLLDEDITRTINVILADGCASKVLKDSLRLFLYAKGILFDKLPIDRIRQFNALLDPNSSGTTSLRMLDKLHKARARLYRIVCEDEESSDIAERLSMFEAFTLVHSEWSSSDTSYVLFRDHPQLRGKPHALVERVQWSGLCYMHAPVVLQHYLVSMTSDGPIPMLDMALYIRQHMNSYLLTSYIWEDIGGMSFDFLHQILMPDPEPLFRHDLARHGLRDSREQLGPGLVYQFEVEPAFMNTSIWQHLNRRARRVPEERIRRHAMVLIGHRQVDGTDRYLLQNWWKSKPFVEVDASYLESCNAHIVFVKTPQTSLGPFPTNIHDHVECELDSPDRGALEMNQS